LKNPQIHINPMKLEKCLISDWSPIHGGGGHLWPELACVGHPLRLKAHKKLTQVRGTRRSSSHYSELPHSW